MPRPGSASISLAGCATTPRESAARTTAWASGCSDARSTDAAIARSSRSFVPAAGTTSVTSGRPVVMVPVLSSTTVVICPARSRISPPRMRIPRSAPRPVPTRIAVGVARPIAQGQAMIITATKATSAGAKRSPGGSRSNQMTNVAMARLITTGVKYPEITSASLAIGARLACASCTIRTICWSVVSRPTLVARNVNEPVALTLPPTTIDPGALSTGSDSPVSIDSSTADAPSTISPSTGMRSPGLMRTTCPTTTSATGISTSAPSIRTRAVRGCRPMSRRIASDVRPLARLSSRRPSRTSATIAVETSK